ncbi:MAG: helicase-related protein [Methylococcaceae bacterium]
MSSKGPETGQWLWSKTHKQPVKVIEAKHLWGGSYYHVWLSQSDALVKVTENQLITLTETLTVTPSRISYLANAARVAASQQEEILLAPISSNVIPLPHQLKALNKAISTPRVRYLLADEVGLGKTIEAGLIMRELKLRGLVRRILVVTPKGLASQWISEMQTHFSEDFQLLLPGEFGNTVENAWGKHDQVICSMDSVKPIEKRKGWRLDKINQYNKQRFDDLISAGWDLIVVDESHRLQGSTDKVARFKLGQGLADAAPYFLLLSATPHQGKSDGFQRLMSLLDRDVFPDQSSITQERVKPYIIRTEKRQAIDAEGNALFQPRKTQLVSVAWSVAHSPQRDLYDAVTEYVREGYNQALATKQNAIGFLMILMQRLVVSSPAAIKATLQRRLEILNKPMLAAQTTLLTEEDWDELDGQQQADQLLNSRVKSLKNEIQEVQWLLDLADQCVQRGIDAKADALLAWITTLQREENEPNLKVLIFTEFVPTQAMLAEFLSGRGFSVVTLNGSLSMDERKHVQQEFAKDTRILISTDAGGEGLNLQFCHVIINYDIPWNPMRLEQRIGRVDRIGQKKVVRALNLVFEDTVEHRVREVLEEKLNIILEEFGVDKTSDVLDSAEAGHLFDELYTGALQNPEAIDEEIEKALQELREQAKASQESKYLFTDDSPIDTEQAEALRNHPLPYWIERMTLSFLEQAEAASVDKTKNGWRLYWPDGETWENCIFSNSQAEEDQSVQHVTLDIPKIRDLVQDLPVWISVQPIPSVSIPTIPDSVDGFWSLWKISLESFDDQDGYQASTKQVFFPVYHTDDGKCFPATAKRVWEALLSNDEVVHNAEHTNTEGVFDDARQHAEVVGTELFNLLKQKHTDALAIEKEKSEYGFTARRRAIECIGLEEVQNFRLARLENDIKEWQQSFDQSQQVVPELSAVLILSISPNGDNNG